jgi:hypothetical protein
VLIPSRLTIQEGFGADVGGRTALVEQDTRPLSLIERSRAGARALVVGASTGAVMGLIVAAAYVAGTADARQQHDEHLPEGDGVLELEDDGQGRDR